MSDVGAHAHGRARRIGYRLLPGDGFSYILHLRPREWPIMAAHTALGFVLATGLAPALRGAGWRALAITLLAWVACLNGGTLALNSAFDRDEGDVGYLDAPPPPPRHLALWGVALMAVGQGLAARLPTAVGIAYAVCFALSMLYSVPPVRLKAVAGADWAINIVGFGVLTPYAGWAATGRALTPEAAWVLLAFGPLFAALYPLTQLYQFDEDQRRGDRTLAIRLGMRGSLLVAVVAAAVAFALFARGGLLARLAPWQWALLALAGGSWGAVLLPWLRSWRIMSPRQHQRGMYAALAAWAVTDVAVVLAFAA